MIAAHEHKKLEVAHAARFTPYLMSLGAKVDFVTHVPVDKALEPADVARLVDEKRVSIPPLIMMQTLNGSFNVLGGWENVKASALKLY